MGHLDDMLQLSGLLLDLRSEEESGRSNNLAGKGGIKIKLMT